MKAGLLLLLVAIPWYFRDQKAASLDHQNDLVQKALVQAANQEQAEAQNRDQREVLTRLKNLEAASAKNDVEHAWRDFADEVRRDGEDLERQAEELQGLVKDHGNAGLTSELGDTLTQANNAVKKSQDVGKQQKHSKSNGPHSCLALSIKTRRKPQRR